MTRMGVTTAQGHYDNGDEYTAEQARHQTEEQQESQAVFNMAQGQREQTLAGIGG